MVTEELINKAFSEAMAAHKYADKEFLENRGSSEVIFSFPGSWSVKDWYSEGAFGETGIDSAFFPSLRSLGNNEYAVVNKAFQERFKLVAERSQLRNRVCCLFIIFNSLFFFVGPHVFGEFRNRYR